MGPEPLQPLQHGGTRLGAHLGRVLMRLVVASGHAGRLMLPIASIGQHCAANSLPDHRPTLVDQRQLTSTVLSARRMALVRDPLTIPSARMGWKIRMAYDACTYTAAANRTPVRRRCHHDLQGQRDPHEEDDGTPPGALFSLSFSLFPSAVTPAFSWPIKGKAGRPIRGHQTNDQNT